MPTLRTVWKNPKSPIACPKWNPKLLSILNLPIALPLKTPQVPGWRSHSQTSAGAVGVRCVHSCVGHLRTLDERGQAQGSSLGKVVFVGLRKQGGISIYIYVYEYTNRYIYMYTSEP